MTKAVGIYPVDRNALHIVNYLEKFCPECKITQLMSPYGYSFCGKDLSVVDNRQPTGNIIEEPNIISSNKFSELFILSGNENDPRHVDSVALMQNSLSNGISVHCALELKEQTLASMKGNFTYHGNKTNIIAEFPEFEHIIKDNILYTPNAIVIFVAGYTAFINTNEIAYGLGAKFLSHGYKVAVIAGGLESRLLGMYPLPSFLCENIISEADKIINFNKYLQCIELTAQPDVIIVQIPGGLECYSSVIHNDFGVYCSLISRAVLPDVAVLCTLFDDCDDTRINIFNENNGFKFSFDLVHMSNVMVNPLTTIDSFCYVHQSIDKISAVLDKCRDNKMPVFDFISENSCGQAFEHILSLIT